MNYNLLRKVVFADLKVGDRLVTCWATNAVVAYKSNSFAVLKYEDDSESPNYGKQVEANYKLVPLCWVEDKPVYKGDVLYRPDLEGNKEMVADSVFHSGDGVLHLHFKDLEFANEYADNRRGYLTWTKPEPERVPSFQVEGQDVFPGDIVYYYGEAMSMWGDALIVENDGYVAGCLVNEYNNGAESFRLKPQLVIGNKFVPMPEREAIKNETHYFVPNIFGGNFYSKYLWSSGSVDHLWLERGLIHLTKEAAIAHAEALIELSKKG